jgi:hypothetical protein
LAAADFASSGVAAGCSAPHKRQRRFSPTQSQPSNTFSVLKTVLHPQEQQTASLFIRTSRFHRDNIGSGKPLFTRDPAF